MTNWIPLTGPGSRMPTREDADETGNVLKRWKNGDIAPGPWNTKPETGSTYVAWMPIPPYTPPKPEPTDEELDALLNQLASAHGTSYPRRIARDWFADVTARIEREKGK